VIIISQIQVAFVSRDVLDVTWRVRPHFETGTDYTFQVLRSNASQGPYVQISEALVDTYAFRDVGVNMHSLNREWYFQVKVTNTITAETVTFGNANPDSVYNDGATPGGVAMESVPEPLVIEARAKLELVLKEFAGRRVLWFPRRTTGQYCSCIDTLTKQRKRSHCTECFGGGFAGGFFDPVELWIQMSPSIEKGLLAWLGRLEPRQSSVLTTGTYRPDPGDMLVEIEGRRWIIDRVQPSEKLRARVRNVMVAHELQKGDVEFDVLVTWGRDGFTANPLRQMLPATDVESYRQALSDAGQT
jgi:hypothetical protein